jgi:phage-related protein
LKIGLEGEKEFKKALSDINSSFKVLGSEMKLVSSQFDKNDSSVQALTARNTVLNKEIETQKQKVETLRSALQNAADSFGENDKRTQSWQIQLNNAEASLNDMERELDSNNKALEEAESGFDDAGKEAENFGNEVDNAGNQSEDAGGKLEKVGEIAKNVGKVLAAAVVAIGTAAVAAGKQIWDMANDVAEAGDAIDKTSQKIGISAESYQEWDYVFERCGSDVDNLQTGMKKLSGVITDAANGSDSAVEKLNAVGLSIEDLNGKSQDEQLSIVISALQGMESGAERTSAATDLLGKSATDMAAVLNMSAEETEVLKQEAQDYGMVMSNEAVAASAAFEDSLTKLKGTVGGLKNSMVGDLLPGITMVMDGLSDLVAGNESAAEELETGISSVIDSVSEMIPQAVELISLIASAILESAPTIISALAEGVIGAIPTLIPVVSQVIAQLVSVLIELLPQIVEAGMEVLTSLISGISQSIPQIVPTIVQVVATMVQTLVDNLPLLLEAALQLITGLAQGLLDAIPVLIDALPEIILSIVNFLLDSIPQIIDAGIQLLTSLVEALPTIITSIVEAIPKIIDGIITAVIESIPQIIEAGIKLLVSLIQALPQIITTVVQAIPQIISSLVDAIIGNIDKIIMAGVELFVSLIENLPTIIVEIVKAVPQIIEGIVKAFGSLMGKIVEIGGNIVKGLWEGIQKLASWLWDKVSGWISSIWDGICDFFGIHSPSKEMAWVGEMLVKGLSGSIEDNGDEAVKAAEGMASDIDDVMTDLAHDMQTALPTDFDVNGNIQSAYDGFTGGISSGFSIALNIATFNNYSSEDIRQLTNEVMETANQFAMRKGVVFA